jgi:hypothetical protein
VAVPHTAADCRQSLETLDLVSEEQDKVYRYPGYLLTPVTYTISALFSGTYVLINNLWVDNADPSTADCVPSES